MRRTNNRGAIGAKEIQELFLQRQDPDWNAEDWQGKDRFPNNIETAYRAATGK